MAMVSLHTSPLLRPGTGDAGGLNVYVAQTATRLARRGVAVDVFTRAVPGAPTDPVPFDPDLPALVHHLPAGPPDLTKEALAAPAHLAEFADGLGTRMAAVGDPPDVLHTHYWLSGAAALPVARRLGIPLVHTMHTTGRVKNRDLAAGERPEPQVRLAGEEELVRAADALVANTEEEAGALVDLLGADPGKVRVVHPGVDLETFAPGSQARARAALGVPEDAVVVLFVGRVQPLKAPDVLVRAAGELLRHDPGLRGRLHVVVLGGLSGSGLAEPDLVEAAVREEGLQGVVRTGPPVSRAELARWYVAADLLAVPSRSESFGLVAVEALASGTPVVAARVGGLPSAVGEAGLLVDGHDPEVWARALTTALRRLDDPEQRRAWSATGVAHAQGLSWERTVDGLLATYAAARADHGEGVAEGAPPRGAIPRDHASPVTHGTHPERTTHGAP